jgi:hypothetical protein
MLDEPGPEMSESRSSGSVLRVASGSMRRTTMSGDDTEAPTLIRLLSASGLVPLALLGITVLAVSRIVGAETIVRERPRLRVT